MAQQPRPTAPPPAVPPREGSQRQLGDKHWWLQLTETPLGAEASMQGRKLDMGAGVHQPPGQMQCREQLPTARLEGGGCYSNGPLPSPGPIQPLGQGTGPCPCSAWLPGRWLQATGAEAQPCPLPSLVPHCLADSPCREAGKAPAQLCRPSCDHTPFAGWAHSNATALGPLGSPGCWGQSCSTGERSRAQPGSGHASEKRTWSKAGQGAGCAGTSHGLRAVLAGQRPW